MELKGDGLKRRETTPERLGFGQLGDAVQIVRIKDVDFGGVAQAGQMRADLVVEDGLPVDLSVFSHLPVECSTCEKRCFISPKVIRLLIELWFLAFSTLVS